MNSLYVGAEHEVAAQPGPEPGPAAPMPTPPSPEPEPEPERSASSATHYQVRLRGHAPNMTKELVIPPINTRDSVDRGKWIAQQIAAERARQGCQPQAQGAP